MRASRCVQRMFYLRLFWFCSCCFSFLCFSGRLTLVCLSLLKVRHIFLSGMSSSDGCQPNLICYGVLSKRPLFSVFSVDGGNLWQPSLALTITPRPGK